MSLRGLVSRAVALFVLSLLASSPLAGATPAAAAYAFGGRGDDKLAHAEATRDGGYVLAGTSESFGGGGTDVWVLRLDAKGAPVWQQTYGGRRDEEALTIRETRGGDFLVVGSTESFGAGGRDVWVLRLSPAGAVVWQKTYGTKKGEGPLAAALTEDDGCVVLFEQPGAIKANYLQSVRLDREGRVVWHQQYDIKRRLSCFLVEAGDGDFLAAINRTFFKIEGRTGAPAQDSAGDGGAWAQAYRGEGSYISALARFGDGYLIGGRYDYGCSRTDFEGNCQQYDEYDFVSKLDEGGVALWTRNFIVPTSLAPTPDGGFLLAGVTITGSLRKAILSLGLLQKYHSVVAKFDGEGKLAWQRVMFPTSSPKLKTPGAASRAHAAASRAPGGGYAVAGTSKSKQTDNDFYLFGLADGETNDACNLDPPITPVGGSTTISPPYKTSTRLDLRPHPPRLTETTSSAQPRSSPGFITPVCEWWARNVAGR